MSWRAGFGRAVITPALPVALAGFSERAHPAEKVHDDLEARALWISDGERAACLVVCDLLAMSAEYSDPARDAIAAALGIERAAVVTASTHTHHGPSALRGTAALNWPEQDGYAEILTAGCLAAATDAAARAEDATLHYARAPLPEGVSINRRSLPYSPTFAVLDVRRPGGERIGTLSNLAIHPVVLGSGWYEVSTDWVGPFRARAEEFLGGCSIMLSGALGDVNPVERHTDLETHYAEAPAEAAAIAGSLAEAVRALCDTAEPINGSLSFSSRAITTVAAGTPLCGLLAPGGHITVELIEWLIGSLSLVTVPGEAFHALGAAIEASRGGRVLVAGLAPTWNGYLPQPFGAGYEEMVSFGPQAVSDIAAALVETGA